MPDSGTNLHRAPQILIALFEQRLLGGVHGWWPARPGDRNRPSSGVRRAADTGAGRRAGAREAKWQMDCVAAAAAATAAAPAVERR